MKTIYFYVVANFFFACGIALLVCGFMFTAARADGGEDAMARCVGCSGCDPLASPCEPPYCGSLINNGYWCWYYGCKCKANTSGPAVVCQCMP